MERTRRKDPTLDSDDEDEQESKFNKHFLSDFKTQLEEAKELHNKSQIKLQKQKKEIDELFKELNAKKALKKKPLPKSRKPSSKKAIKEAQKKYVHAVEVEVPLKRKRGRPRKDAPKRELDYSILETVKHLKAGRGMKPAVIDNGVRREATMPEYLKQF